MIKALLLIFEPIGTWDGIFRAKRAMGSILTLYLIPMLLLTCIAEGYGLARWGKTQGEYAHTRLFSPKEAFVFETGQFVIYLAIFFIGAKLIKSIGETFHGRHTYSQAFTTIAYGLSPLLLLRLLDALPGMSPWVSWPIGIILSIGVLYQGIPRIMEPDPPHAFGLYLMSALLLCLITGLFRFLTAWYLTGKFVKLDSIISDIAARLPF